MERRTFLGVIAGGLLAAPLVAEPQSPAKVPRIGILFTSNPVLSAHSAVNAPAAGGALPTNVQPVGGSAGAAPAAGAAPTGPTPAPAASAPAPQGGGDAGTAGAGPGATSGDAPGPPGDAGVGGGGAGGGGSTVLCSYTINRIELAPRERKIVFGWWGRTHLYLLEQERGEADFAAYTETATRITKCLDSVSPELRAEALAWFKRLLVDPILRDSSWDPVRAESGLTVLSSLAALLAQACGIPVPAHSQALVGLRELEWVASVGADARELTGAKQTAVAG